MVLATVWAGLMLTCGIALGVVKSVNSLQVNIPYPLDMAPNSVDDMYIGCRDKMLDTVKKNFLWNEKNMDGNFSLAWSEAEKYYNKKWNRRGRKPSTGLGKEQVMALYAYSLDNPKVYLSFNSAVRTQKSQYRTTFNFHALHYFLTVAVQTLNARKTEEDQCLTGYRRVNAHFVQENVLNKEMRFGAFTSSSLGWYSNADGFGDKSCFEIITCAGADISLYSKLGEAERELLIPPYEVFKVTEIKTRSEKRTLPCEVVYKVKSTRKALSYLNCALI